jgi:hypothetical protein
VLAGLEGGTGKKAVDSEAMTVKLTIEAVTFSRII